jgi:hypothetical protein
MVKPNPLNSTKSNLEGMNMRQVLSKVCLVFGTLLLLGVGSGLAQAGYGLRVEVPFPFTAGNSHFEEGQFLIKEGSTGLSMLLVSSLEGKDGGILFTNGTMLEKASFSKPRLIFNQYGDHYFLSQIWFGGGDIGCQLRPSKAEKESAQSATAMNLKTSVIEIVAR